MTAISFEFYPPKTDEQRNQLDRTAQKLKRHHPAYVSCTFGANGSTLAYTAETIRHLQRHHAFDAAPHLSCVGGSRAKIGEMLDLYRDIGCRRIVALRGDTPSGMGHFGDLRYAADLVGFIRDRHGSHFHIEIAAYPEVHPQAKDAIADLEYFKAKVDAGADAAITQYFYNADAYFHFVDAARKRGVDIPIVPGIMPISNFNQLSRFSASCGAEIPRWISRHMQALGDDDAAMRELGADIVAALCQRLLEGGAPGLHFYTLNLARPTQSVLARLSL